MVSVGSLPYGMTKAALDHFTRLISLELAPKGVRVITVSPGVTESEFVKRITVLYYHAHAYIVPRLDVLVNNAGISTRTCLQVADMATFDEVFRVDVRGVYQLTKLLVPALIETGGNIVNVSSISGTMVVVGSLPYGMAKAALDHFTRLVALELAPKGVRVNAVSPGVTVSKIVKRMTGCTEEQYQSWLSSAASTVPMGEVCQGGDIARMIVHLASDSSRLVTGTVVPVDGGLRFSGPSNLLSQQMKRDI
uniref:SFRICE_019512 n=1 Tax=Spodoptera frugiperda TaxID=7108 RepID=A0A2H1VTV0_SPOFR